MSSKKNANKKRNRSNRVEPEKGMTEKEMTEMSGGLYDSDDNTPGMHGIAQAVIGAKNLLKELPSAKKAAGKWKHYVTRRRKLGNRGVQSCLDESKTSAESRADEKDERGLDEIDSAARGRSVAASRSLVQYFAKLGQPQMSNIEELDLTFVEGLIEQGADINCSDRYGQTIFHEVARTWHPDVGKFLLEHDAEIDKKDLYGRTPLHVAAAVNYPEMCDFLIKNGADKESLTKTENQTPMFYAARNDATKSLTMLIKHKCQFKTIQDYRGRTPLYVAAELDRSETARLLLEHNAPVSIVDNYNQPALTFMIQKMAPVAKEALNQLHTTDRANRKQFFYLNYLEPFQPDEKRDGCARTPLEVLVRIKNFDLVIHPVMLQLIKVKWNFFGRFGALKQLISNMFFVILWTTIAVYSPWYSKCHYNLPADIWKIVIYVLAVGMTIYQIGDELWDFFSTQREHRKWKTWRIDQLEEDKQFCHPRWPEEKLFLENEIIEIEKDNSNYFSDLWNILDWICYVFLLASTCTHLVDVFLPGIVIAQWHNRIMAINIVFVWLRTMKYVRCFSAIGPFVVMLGEILGDLCRWLFLYVVFYVPFACAFWMIFGGVTTGIQVTNATATCVAANMDALHQIDIKGMTVVDETLFTLFRLTLVDEYDLDNMLEKDKGMTYLLLLLWFGISSILLLNLFIALLSDTFQRVYDNAKSNAVMQKAITVLTIEEDLMKKRLKQYRIHIHENCSPERLYYDDDTGENDDELKKVTIQVKEKIDNIIEMWHLKFGSPFMNDEGDRFYPSEERAISPLGDDKSTGTNKTSSKLITAEKLENEIDILRAELLQVEKKRRDFERVCLAKLEAINEYLQPQQGPYQRPVNTIAGINVELPPTYPAVMSERLTPRGQQIGGDASVSNVDISTLQEPGV